MSALKHRRKNTLLVRMMVIALFFGLSGCFQKQGNGEDQETLYWLEDASGVMTFDEVLRKDLSSDWNVTEGHYPNLGFTNSTVWLSLPIENRKVVSVPILIEMAFPLHDQIDVYLLQDDKVVKTYRSGDQQNFAKRPLDHRHFLFPYTVSAQSKLRAIMRVQSTDTMYLPAKVSESNAFYIEDQRHILLLGLFFGFLSIMLIYNLLLYCSTHHKSYLYYVWCTASIVYFQLTQKGLGFQFFWSDSPLFNHLSVPIVSFLTMGSSLLFIRSFLDLNGRQQPKTLAVFNWLIWGAAIGAVVTSVMVLSDHYIIPYSRILIGTAILGIAVTVMVIALLSRLSLKGSRSAQILLMAWLSLLVGICLFGLGRIGVPIPMILSENAMLIGSTFEAALISFALARDIKKEREGRMKAQELALLNERKTRDVQNSLLRLKEKTTQQLEQEVKERTQKLEHAMKELTMANLKLDNLARLDGLTGLSNRRNFDQKFDMAWCKNIATQQPISILMADIDYFKRINDTYGHLFGDECLVQVAAVLKACVSQPEYLAARFGGEEFIIMLPNADAAMAVIIAEQIRQSIEKIRLKYERQSIKFTISIGVATVTPSGKHPANTLKESADQALYLAKEAGRNCVSSLDSLPNEVMSG